MLTTKPLDIRADHAEIIHKILKDNLEEGTYVFAFGSRANWTAKQSSDLDLAIDGFRVKLDKKIKSNLEDVFEESDLPYKVDVVDLNSVSESFREAIQDQLVRVLWDWRQIKVGDYTEIFSGGTPNTKMSEYWNGEFYWLASGETKNKFIYGTEKRITEEGIKKSSTRLAKCGSVVIAGAGQGYTRGQTSLLKIDTYLNQSLICINSLDQSLLLNQWVFYNLSNRYFELRQISDSHSSRGSLTTALLKQLNLLCPPLPEQKRIAEILSSLDNKIEINKQINQTLEEIAEALFKSWFINFDPVRVKKAALEAGAGEKEANLAVMKFISSKTDEELEKFRDDYPEKYRELEDVAKLFPAEFQNSELGEVPLGWEVKMLSDIGTIVTGTTPDKSDWTIDGDVPFITPSDFGCNNYFLIETIRYVSGKLKSTIRSRFIPANSVLVTCIGSDMGKVTINTRECLTNQQINSIVPNKHYSGNESFLYFMLKHKRTFLRSIAEAGSTMPIINKTQFSRVKILVPHNSLLSIFKKRNLENNRLIHLSLQQTSNLTLVNDQLRNKLLIGEAIIYKNHKKALISANK
jgi:type I restriction enzyme S subunit